MRRDRGLARLEVRVGEVRPGGDPELAEQHWRTARGDGDEGRWHRCRRQIEALVQLHLAEHHVPPGSPPVLFGDRKSTRLNSSHGYISYAVFCLKKKNFLLLS